MIILINSNNQPFRIEYTKGKKAFVKQIPVHKIVAMKDLHVAEQISNRKFLFNKGITILNYETGVYYHKNDNADLLFSTLPFEFVGNNVKKGTSIIPGFSGNTTQSGMTFVADNVHASTIFKFVTSAGTMANNTAVATTIGVNTYITFSGSSVTTQTLYGALTASTFSGLGISITGQGASKPSTSVITFYLSATTADANSAYAFMKSMV